MSITSKARGKAVSQNKNRIFLKKISSSKERDKDPEQNLDKDEELKPRVPEEEGINFNWLYLCLLLLPALVPKNGGAPTLTIATIFQEREDACQIKKIEFQPDESRGNDKNLNSEVSLKILTKGESLRVLMLNSNADDSKNITLCSFNKDSKEIYVLGKKRNLIGAREISKVSYSEVIKSIQCINSGMLNSYYETEKIIIQLFQKDKLLDEINNRGLDLKEECYPLIRDKVRDKLLALEKKTEEIEEELLPFSSVAYVTSDLPNIVKRTGSDIRKELKVDQKYNEENSEEKTKKIKRDETYRTIFLLNCHDLDGAGEETNHTGLSRKNIGGTKADWRRLTDQTEKDKKDYASRVATRFLGNFKLDYLNTHTGPVNSQKLKDYYDWLASRPKKAVSAAALFTKGEKILVLKPTYKDGWTLVGGVVELEESPLDGCKREVKEETGIEMKESRLLCVHYRSLPGREGQDLITLITLLSQL